MGRNFEEELDDLINSFLEEDMGSVDDVISALELKLMALKKEQKHG